MRRVLNRKVLLMLALIFWVIAARVLSGCSAKETVVEETWNETISEEADVSPCSFVVYF